MKPREVEDAIARDILGWVFIKDGELDCGSGPGWYKQNEHGDFKFVGWPDAWATDMDAMWKLAGQLAKNGVDWQLSTKKKGRIGSFVKLINDIEDVEAEAGPDQMPLAMCLALLKMAEAKKTKTANGLKTV